MQGREYLPIVNPLVMKIGLTETFSRMAEGKQKMDGTGKFGMQPRGFDHREIQDILAMTGEIKPVGISVRNRVFREYVAVYESFEIVRINSQNLQDTAGIIVPVPYDAQEQMVMADGVIPRPHCFIPSIADDEIQFL